MMRLIALMLLAPAAYAGCGATDVVRDRLAKQYGETAQAKAITNKGGLLEVYASQATGTWTVVITRPDGVSCILSAGRDYAAAVSGPQGDDL